MFEPTLGELGSLIEGDVKNLITILFAEMGNDLTLLNSKSSIFLL